MEHVIWEGDRPDLRSPVLVCAFAGWNDAASAATTELEAVAAALDSQVVARLDPEEFYDFQVNRPTIRLTDGRTRHVDWPDAHKAVVQNHLVGRLATDIPLWRLSSEQKAPAFVEDTTTNDLLDPRLCQALDLSSYLSVPLLSGDRLAERDVPAVLESVRAGAQELRRALLG